MKNQILLLFALCLTLSTSLFSQEAPVEENAFKPDDREWGIALEAIGLKPIIEDPVQGVFNSTNLLLKYNKDGYFTYRIKLGVNVLRTQTGSESGTDKSTLTESQSGVTLAPGLEYHFAGSRRLDPFIGFQLPIGFQGKHKTEQSDKIGATKTVVTVSEPGSLSAGLDFVTGFNFFIADRFAVGLEYNIGFRFRNRGGNSLTVVKVDGAETLRTESTDIDTEVFAANRGVGAVSLTYFFGH